MPVRSLTVFALVLSAGLGSGAGWLSPPAPAAQEKKDERKTDDFPKLIVGKWEITKAGGDAPAGTVIEFGKDKKAVMTLKSGDETFVTEGTWAIEKDQLTLKFKFNEVENTETLTVTKLTEDAMELKDAKGGVDVLKKRKG